MTTFGSPKCRRFGQSALRLETTNASAAPVALHLRNVARATRRLPGVREAVVGAGNLTVIFDRGRMEYDALAAAIAVAWQSAAEETEPERTIEIPVWYGGQSGPDLDEVAERCDLSAAEVIEAHAAAMYVVAFVGFQPGFGYLDGLDKRLHLPRRAQPRTRVPSGSVAIAGAQSAVYPLDSPGGWHLIGRTDLHLFDAHREPFALLEAGDRVRFVPR
jgi:KipI family sensor histidine kinase inhibitor